MLILGINCYLHDSSACLISDGRIVAFAEEERFNRDKHCGCFPKLAIEYCLREANIRFSDIDHVAYYWNPWIGLVERAMYMMKSPARTFGGGGRKTGGQASVGAWSDMINLKKKIAHEFGMYPSKIRLHYVHHHLAHAASTFFVSPFETADIITIDAAGEWDTCMKLTGEANQIHAVQKLSCPQSLGNVYGALTQYLGYQLSYDEGKVMGLASYGHDTYRDFFDRLVVPTDDGLFRVDDSCFNMCSLRQPTLYGRKIVEQFGPPRGKKEPITKHHEDIASSLQHMTDRVGLHLAKTLHARTGNKNLCLAGGVALNSVMNGHILLNGPYEKVFIQPAAADNGTSLGCALYLYHSILGQPRNFVMEHAYWGPGFSDRECEEALQRRRVPYRRVENAEATAAKWIADGRIIGWFQGRMEVGPRALGNRSIVADPRRAEMKDILNARVKHREAYRPFAPSCLAEKAAQYFDSHGHPSPYMLLVFDVLPDKRSVLPAITHVDNTGRLQTVTRGENARYYKLIEEFEKLTGVPVILNTSFNVMGEPIVCTPDDAVRCYVGTGIDCLVLGNFVAEKPAS